MECSTEQGNKMEYILLLRGINVGGNHKVAMSELKEQLNHLSYNNVRSYINSGNLFFESEHPKSQLVVEIKNLLEQHYAFEIPFALIDAGAFVEEYEQLPAWWQLPMARKDVLFYIEASEREQIVQAVQNYPLHEEKVYFGQHAIYWGKLDEAEYLKTAYHKRLIKEPFYRQLTIRNGRTYEKIKAIIN